MAARNLLLRFFLEKTGGAVRLETRDAGAHDHAA
jgi:hypothetical protein